VLFRSLRSLAGRALAAGAASALTLTLVNAAQPTLTTHKVQPGTLKNIKVTLTPAPAPTTGPAAAGPAGAVDNSARPSPRTASVPLRGAEPGTGSVKRAPGATAAPGAIGAPGATTARAPQPRRVLRLWGPGCSRGRWTWARRGS